MMNKDGEDIFNFFIDLDVIEKSKNAAGEEVMKIGGIASTADKDLQGDQIVQEGWNVQPFLESGWFNWHHTAKNNPLALIGTPTKAEVRPGQGLYVEGELMAGNPIAEQVYMLAKIIKKQKNPKRRLGFSVEGKATERDPFDDKKVLKADLRHMAVTFAPISHNTLLDVLKGDSSEEDFTWDVEDHEKVFPFIKEMFEKSVDSDQLDLLSINSFQMKNDFDKTDIIKVISIEHDNFLNKGKTMSEQKMFMKSTEGDFYHTLKKSEDDGSMCMDTSKKYFLKSDGSYEAEEDDDDDDEMSKGFEDDKIFEVFSSINKQNKAIGNLLSKHFDEFEELKKSNMELLDLVKSLDDESGKPTALRSASKPSNSRAFERVFADDSELNKALGDNMITPSTEKVLSISRDKTKMVGLLDDMTFSKGTMDAELSKAVLQLEGANVLTVEGKNALISAGYSIID